MRLGWPVLFTFLFLSCSGESTEILNISSFGNGVIVTSSWDGNHRAVTYYDISGNYVTHVDFRTEGVTPRGLHLLDPYTILMSGEGNDAIYTLDFDGNHSLFYGASSFAGNIWDLVYDATAGIVYAIESDRIEAFDTNGLRDTTKYIPTTTGACTLSVPVAMIINSAGQLVVSNVGGADQILTYDITTTPPSCVSAVNFGNNPYGIVEHSDGNLYVTTHGDDEISRADPDGSNRTTIWTADTTILNNPTAIDELPNGNLIVSGANNDTIEEITTAGVRVGATPFIRDALSLNIGNILVVGGSSQ